MASKSDKQAGKDRRDAQREAPADRPWGEGAAVPGYGAFHAWDVDDAPVSDRGPVQPRKAA